MTRKNYLKGEFIFENILTVHDTRDISDVTINRDVGGLITTVVKDEKTVTVNRDVNDVITSYEDADYEWTLTRDVDGNITNIGVSKK